MALALMNPSLCSRGSAVRAVFAVPEMPGRSETLKWKRMICKAGELQCWTCELMETLIKCTNNTMMQSGPVV